MAQVRFDRAYGACVAGVASVLNTGIYCGTKNVARNAFRTSTIKPQYMTKLAMGQVCDQPGLNVSITVWQLRCDIFFCILCETGVHHEA